MTLHPGSDCRAASQVRAFVKNKEGLAKQELNQSPLPFIESAAQTGARPRGLLRAVALLLCGLKRRAPF